MDDINLVWMNLTGLHRVLIGHFWNCFERTRPSRPTSVWPHIWTKAEQNYITRKSEIEIKVLFFTGASCTTLKHGKHECNHQRLQAWNKNHCQTAVRGLDVAAALTCVEVRKVYIYLTWSVNQAGLSTFIGIVRTLSSQFLLFISTCEMHMFTFFHLGEGLNQFLGKLGNFTAFLTCSHYAECILVGGPHLRHWHHSWRQGPTRPGTKVIMLRMLFEVQYFNNERFSSLT